MLLSIVIPVYNEKGTFDTLLGRIAQVPLAKEVVVVDDASTDGTRERIQRLEASIAEKGVAGALASVQEAGARDAAAPLHPMSIRFLYHPENRGKGAAVRTGIAASTGDIVVVQDADLEYDPADYPALVAPIVAGTADVVYGSRLLGGGLRNGYFGNYLANRALTLLSNLFTGWRLTDMETCYKTMRGEIARDLKLTSDRFGFDPEITAKLARRGARVAEVPVRYQGRSYAEGKKIRWQDGFVVVRAILRYAGGD